MTHFDSSNSSSLNTALNVELHHNLVSHLGNSFIAGIAVFITFFAIYFFFSHQKTFSKKQKIRYRFRIIYLAIFSYLVLLARIWVEGFEHIFTVLSLVSAGIVVTNKETVMNFVGWLIINWRNLFIEGDVIQIGTNIGIVNRIGPLYFWLHETSGIDRMETTGKSIKIPNGLVITLPVICLSPNNNLIQYTFTLLAQPELKKLEATLSHLQEKFNQILTMYYEKNAQSTFERLEFEHPNIAAFISKKCAFHFQYTPGKDKHAEITFRFFCYPKDLKELQWQFLEIIEQDATKGKIFLAEVS